MGRGGMCGCMSRGCSGWVGYLYGELSSEGSQGTGQTQSRGGGGHHAEVPSE